MWTTTMAKDQHGNYFHDLGVHPRKELLKRLGAKNAEVMRCDPDGKHVGYIINGLWLHIYKVTEWR